MQSLCIRVAVFFSGICAYQYFDWREIDGLILMLQLDIVSAVLFSHGSKRR